VAGACVGAEVGAGGLKLSAFSVVAAHQSAQTSVNPSSELSRSIWVWLKEVQEVQEEVQEKL
jgi:hypothetical protein